MTLDPQTFDPHLHCSPYELFRRLQEGTAPLLLDLRGEDRRREPGALVLTGARPWPEEPAPPDREVVLVDDDGAEATRRARALREDGFLRVRALYGGLRLYDHALDPGVVGGERFLAACRV
jgi:rhodanese-related sulfurtransferase